MNERMNETMEPKCGGVRDLSVHADLSTRALCADPAEICGSRPPPESDAEALRRSAGSDENVASSGKHMCELCVCEISIETKPQLVEHAHLQDINCDYLLELRF